MRQLCLTLLCLVTLVSLKAQETDDLIHSVAPGETLTLIAGDYGVTLDQLLELNNLDPDAYLQIGQRLLVIPDAAAPDDDDESIDEGEREDEDAPPMIAADEEPGAPVVEASAPMTNPADLSPQLCFTIFADENSNGMREPDEPRLADGEIILFDAEAIEQLHYTTDGQSEPYCVRDLGRRLYRLEASPPAGYGLSDANSLLLDMRVGGKIQLEFSAGQGFATGSADEPGPDLGARHDGENASLLREVSGLVVLALAVLTFAGGMVVALILRSR